LGLSRLIRLNVNCHQPGTWVPFLERVPLLHKLGVTATIVLACHVTAIYVKSVYPRLVIRQQDYPVAGCFPFIKESEWGTTIRPSVDHARQFLSVGQDCIPRIQIG
jgi:hypothetical protein